MADDELHYLQPGFDLSSLTVPKIREILVSHDISYPSSAKKPQLIQILTDELLPKARKLLNARARTKRTSRGIQDMPSSQESSTIGGDDDQDGELMPPPPPPKTPRGRKSKASLAAQAAAEEGDIPATPATARRARTPGRQKSTSKHPRASDTETEPERPPPSARKTRKSTPGPVPVEHTHSVKIEEPDHRIKRESLENGASPFSDENPFQSGSSPGSESRRVSSTSRTRKSLGAPSIDRRKSTSTSRRRQTTSPTQAGQEDQYDVPSRSTFEFPVARVKSEEAEDAVPTTEEFTPEEQLELSRDRAAQGYSASESIPTRSRALVRRKKKPTSTAVKSAPVVVLTTVLAAIGAWYRKEKVEVGYCGVGKPSWSLADNPQIPGWVHETLQPQCEPCPQHAYCYPGMEVACETNYVLQPHPLSLGGAVPLPPTCEPDGEKVKRIKAVADKAIEELRDRRAIYECGDEFKPTAAESSAPVDVKTVVKGGEMKLEIAEEDLKKEVGKQRRKGMSGEEFEDLWQSALGDIMERDEVEVTKDGSGRVLLSSSSLARLPFSCAVRRSVLQSVSRHRIPISILILAVSAIGYLRKRVVDYQQATAQIPALVATTLDRLATQAALAADGRVSEGFISIGQLRDDVLRAVLSASERERVWKGVRAIVEGNANVRAASREDARTGELSRVWEWIGPVNLAPGLEGRKSGGIIEDRPASEGTDGGELVKNSKEVIETRKWDEGRPIY